MREAEIRPPVLFDRYLELARRDAGRLLRDRRGFVDVSCPACGGDQWDLGLEKLGFRYVVCRSCGSLYVSPRPSAEMIGNYYREGEAVRFWSTDFFRDTSEARRKHIFRPRARVVRDWAIRLRPSPPSRLVDVGCGYGIFLEEIHRLKIFHEVWAIEPAPGLAEICREKGFVVIQRMMEDVDPADVRADFFTAFELLEHVYDPLALLLAVRRCLKPRGAFLFTTLTVSGFDIQVLWEHSKSIYPPHHINLLSVKGIECLVKRAGFQMGELRTPGQLDVEIVRNAVEADPSIPVPRFVRHLTHGISGNGRGAFQRFLQAQGLSSHVRVVALAGPDGE